MAKPRAVLESMAVTLLETMNEDGHLATYLDVDPGPVLWFRTGVMEASIYPEKPLEAMFLVENYLIKWR